MFRGSMTAKKLISLARDACDISPAADDEYYLFWLSSLESALYTGMIKSTASDSLPLADGIFDPAGAQTDGEAVRACDVRRVFAGSRELARTDAEGAAACPDMPCFYESGGKIRVRAPYFSGENVTAVFAERPKRKTAENMETEYAALPDEFLPMALDYLCGCAYALAGEDIRSDNCFTRYNASLDDFTAWLKGVKGENN